MYRNRPSIACGSSFAMLAASAAVAVAVACSAVGTARASMVVNVELGGGNYNGTGAAPDTGTYWNQYTGSWLTLDNSAGTATNVSFINSGGANYTVSSSNALLGHYLYVNSSTEGFTLKGLTAGGTYDLYLYSANGSTSSQPATFTIGATSLAPGGGNSSATATSIPTSDEGISYVEFTNLTPVFNAGNYEITAAWSNTSGVSKYGVFNGLQLVTAVPEPASLGLVAIGTMGLLLLGRKRKGAV